MLLSNSQRKGAALLFGFAFVAWITVAVWPSRQPPLPYPSQPAPTQQGRSWEERRDSMERADSIRYAQWAAEREQRYRNFRHDDSVRRAEWRIETQQRWDSARVADSLWRDSLGIVYTRHEKRDTILDLNNCDTAQLLLIRGIGRYTATQIIRYRDDLGGYYSTRQLTDEPLANCHLDTLLHHFTVDTTAIQPIDVNNSSIERLQHHPYLRYDQAKAIYQLRRSHVRLNAIDDLKSLPELTEEDIKRIAPYLSFE